MQSQLLKGMKKTKEGNIFPNSPTLLKELGVEDHILQAYLRKRNTYISKKTEEAPIYDERLRPYQNQDVNFLIQFKKGKGVFNQQRIGKTPVTLVAMRTMNQNRNIIIVPKSIIYSWVQEYRKWHKGKVFTVLSSWNKKRRYRAYEELEGTLVINYDKVRLDHEKIIEELGPFDAIVLDEAHMMRNYTSMKRKQTKYEKKHDKKPTFNTIQSILRVRRNSKDAYALTGTPTPNKEHDICGILAFLHNNLFFSKYMTAEYYFNVEQKVAYKGPKKYEYPEIQGFKDKVKKKELLEYLELFSIQRKRKDVMQWLPEVDTETIWLDPSPTQEKYDKELSRYMETMDNKIICENPLTTMVAQRQLTTDPKTLNPTLKIPQTKFEWLTEHVKDYPETPMIIASTFSSTFKNLKKHLEKYQSRIMTGNTSNLQREEIKRGFQNREFNLLIANIDVIKEGITLSKAEELIIIDPSLTYTDNEQLIDRFLPTSKEEALTKEGQKVIHLYIKRTIDTYIHESLRRKKTKTEIINDYLKHLKRG